MFTVYNTSNNNRFYKAFRSESAAKRSCTVANKKGSDVFAIMPCDAYYEMCSKDTVIVKNMMNGADVEIRRDLLGTVCDPSTERYWSF